MSIDLAISLGHNSSCIAIDAVSGNILCGFEEERLSGIKSDSAYPIQSIEKCIALLGNPDIGDIHISHWLADGKLKKCKYYDQLHMSSLNPKKIISVSPEFTHHDAHNYSALAFAQSSPGFEEDFWSLVVDGFGTHGECISLYQSTKRSNGDQIKTRLMHRAFGYSKSLGMLYQYATAFLGLKMHQDEYKLLGYETRNEKLDFEDFETISNHASKISKRYFNNVMNVMAIDKDTDPIVSINALKNAKDVIFKDLWDLLNEFEIDESDSFEARVVVAMTVQKIVEDVVLGLVETYQIKKLICSGGVFMNVKLNMLLTQRVEKLCVMPLAGDQGAALGVYHRYKNNLKWPDNLYWGIRTWNSIDKIENVPGIFSFSDRDDFIDSVVQELRDVGYVNVVMGDMEYGPRALCNTTTLALPTMDNTIAINHLNDRTTIMPMAPVMTQMMAEHYLMSDYKKVHKSLEYMIAACIVKDAEDIKGAAHEYTEEWFGSNFWSCRPQIINYGHPVHEILEIMKTPLINTSFNYHGVPIVYSVDDIINSHIKQNKNGQIKTFILTEKFL